MNIWIDFNVIRCLIEEAELVFEIIKESGIEKTELHILAKAINDAKEAINQD